MSVLVVDGEQRCPIADDWLTSTDAGARTDSRLETALQRDRGTLAIVLVAIPLAAWTWIALMARDMTARCGRVRLDDVYRVGLASRGPVVGDDGRS